MRSMMLRYRFLIVGALAGAGSSLLSARLDAQSVTTAAIRGTVEMADGSDPDGGRVVVRSVATGYVVETEVRRGRFLVQGLEAGGPYTLTVRRIGAVARLWDGLFLRLGEPLDLHVTLEPTSVVLDTLVIVAEGPLPLARRDGGTATALSDSLIHRLPSLNRDVYDFLRLVPQVSTRIGFAAGLSGGGVGFRLNQFLTNGVPERSLQGGQPPEFAGGKSLPFEAVREYQVLVAPFDVRYGDFAGAMVNTVTRSGTNRFGGSLFAQGRSDALSRGGGRGAAPYERWQYGGSLSGPIVRDRVHFLVATEFQDRTASMVGPYVGQPSSASVPVPVSQADLDRLATEMQRYGLVAGSGGRVPNEGTVRNIFARLDASLPRWNSRAVLWLNDSDTRDRPFARIGTPDVFELSSNASAAVFGARTVALQLYTGLPRRLGGQNELSISRRSISFGSDPEVRQPIVEVAVPDTSGRLTTLITGTPAPAHGSGTGMWDVNLRDDLTLPFGAAHVVNLGLEAAWFRVEPTGLPNGYGTWSFLSLDSLQAGQAERFELARDFGSAEVPLSGSQFAAYAGDQWQVGPRLSLTFGLRTDLLAVNGQAPYNRAVDSLFGRRTDQRFRRTIHFSPRIGFSWDLSASRGDQLRGGIGIFTGRPPLAWLHQPLRSYGEGTGTLRCGVLPGDLGLPPPFQPDHERPPLTCAGGEGLSSPPAGDVELIAPDLRMARSLRAVLAYERRLPGGLVGTLEALVTRQLADYAFVNLNLAGPQATDSVGRVLYGSIDTTGRARPLRVTDSLPGVMELRNVSRNHSIQLAAGVSRQFAGGFAVLASYTWSRVRDAQTPLRVNTRGFLNWAARAVSGYHGDLSPGISLNDVPHRVVLAGTWRAPWARWSTELSLMYIGESGSPFTWRAGGLGGRGDLNADGALNDPIYVPRGALDPKIGFTGVSAEPGADNSPAAQAARVLAQRTAFDRFVEGQPCLRRQRGQILERNSCREPWAHTTVASVRQAIPIGGGALEAQLDVFNLLNLLDGDWGHRRIVANPALLEHVGQATGPSGLPEPVFRFTSSAGRWAIEPTESAFQLQLGARYRF